MTYQLDVCSNDEHTNDKRTHAIQENHMAWRIAVLCVSPGLEDVGKPTANWTNGLQMDSAWGVSSIVTLHCRAVHLTIASHGNNCMRPLAWRYTQRLNIAIRGGHPVRRVQNLGYPRTHLIGKSATKLHRQVQLNVSGTVCASRHRMAD